MDGSTQGTQTERERILRMVEDGVLSATEALSLFERLGGHGATAAPASEFDQQPMNPPEAVFAAEETRPTGDASGGSPQWLRVRVTDLASGRKKVSVNIPFGLAAWGLRVGAHFNPRAGDIDLTELSRLVSEDGAKGLLVDVVDEEDQEHVQVFVE